MRSFKIEKAVRRSVPVLFSIMGPSGSGKTYSALRLATGIQRVCGGAIHVIDTEARRALHYADRFDFQHVQFDAPFGPLDYLAAIKHCVSDGARTIVIDSMSHEHEGPGGVLEMHDSEMKRMGGHKMNFPAWAKPKAERRHLINAMIQMPVNFILCFRAKEKTRPKTDDESQGGKKDLIDLGWMPIGGEEFVYEMTGSALLTPGAAGVPEWAPPQQASREMCKLPEQFRSMFAVPKQLDEVTGEAMAKWAEGGPVIYTFPKGEHAGKTVRDVPADYLTRLLDNERTTPNLRAICEAEIERRMDDAQAESEASEAAADEFAAE